MLRGTVGGVRRRTRRGLLVTVFCLSLAPLVPAAAKADAPVDSGPTVEDLKGLSIEQLADLPVTSVSKRAEPLSEAPASIYVITHEDILRSGAQSVPEMLRLAPNLQVYQQTAWDWVVTARGLNGDKADQSFPNKLLVLIDGRTVFTPLFSGVYWDLQQVLPEDIDRIEVIDGPGGTLWGANAINGVVNIITRKASETQGASIDVAGGDFHRAVSAQYGGQAGDAASFRVYGSSFWDADTRTLGGARANDHWTKPQAGFRLDWTPSVSDLVTLQGDIFRGSDANPGAPDELTHGGNLTGRWTRTFHNGEVLQVQGFYDEFWRDAHQTGGRFYQKTYDVEMQDSRAAWGRHQVVWGVGFRTVQYHIYASSQLSFSPAARTLQTGDAFVQDTIALGPRTSLIAGVKAEALAYSSARLLPNLRLTWKASEQAFFWAGVSQAARAVTPFDRDVVEKVGSTVFLTGYPDFEPSVMTAYEAGARLTPVPRLSVSVTAYDDVYQHLRSIEPHSSTVFLPIRWGDRMAGEITGVEAWADYQAAAWWRLGASVNATRDHLHFLPGASGLLGVGQNEDDAPLMASLRSAMTFGGAVSWDSSIRYVAALPTPHVPAYAELDSSLGWRLSERIELRLTGFNLLHPWHQELPPPANRIPRSVFAEARLRF